MSMSHLSREPDLGGRKRIGVAVCQYLGGPTSWHQTGDDGHLDAESLATIRSALAGDGAVALFGADAEHLDAVRAQIEASS